MAQLTYAARRGRDGEATQTPFPRHPSCRAVPIQRSRADGQLAGFIRRRSQVRVLPPLFHGRDRRDVRTNAEVHRSVGPLKSRSALRQRASGLQHMPERGAGHSTGIGKASRGSGRSAYASEDRSNTAPRHDRKRLRLPRPERRRAEPSRILRRGRSGVGTPDGIRLLLEGAFATARLRGRLPAPISIDRRPGVVPGQHSAVYTDTKAWAGTCREGRRSVMSFRGSRCRLGGAVGCLPDLGFVPPSRALWSTRDGPDVRPRSSSPIPHRTVTHV